MAKMPAQSAHCCVTSPPYFGQRDYGVAGQIGLENTPDDYVSEIVSVFREVRRVLRDDGTVWLNLGDSYVRRPQRTLSANKNAGFHAKAGGEAARDQRQIPEGMKPKDIMGIPWAVAFALRDDGWYLRCPIIWKKPFFTVTSQKDRPTVDYEYVFMLSKSYSYQYDHEAVMEIGVNGEKRTLRSVWEVAPSNYRGAHFATFPPRLIEPCIKAGCPEGGTVLDPFGGSGTTGVVADFLKRNAELIELNPEYAAMAERRIHGDAGMFADVRTTAFAPADRTTPPAERNST